MDNLSPIPPLMAVCPCCDDSFCQPEDWYEADCDNWYVFLFCPNCEMHSEGRFTNSQVEAFDIWLDDCTDAIWASYSLLAKFNMRSWGRKFLAALEADAIQPIDF